MDFDKLKRKAQDIYTERGGAKAAKGDAGEVEKILKGDGTMMDKAKRAAKALKQPGAAGDSIEASDLTPPTHTEPPPAVPPVPPSGME